MKVVTLNDVDCEQTSDRRSRRGRKTIWRRLVESMSKMAGRWFDGLIRVEDDGG